MTLFALVLAAGCTDDEASSKVETGETGETGESPSAERVVLLTLDTIRADHVLPDTMPWLTTLAAEGVVWENTWGQSWTYPAIGEILSGRNPAVWGPESYDQDEGHEGPSQVGEDVPLLAEALGGLGWATAYWSSNDVAGDATGLHRGYGLAELFAEGHTVDVVPDIVAWAEANRGVDQFIHFHVNDPHDPYDLWAESCAAEMETLPFDECRYDFTSIEKKDTITVDDDIARGQWGEESSDYDVCRSIIQALYACEVRYQDDALAESWALLGDAGLLDDSLVVVALDHGEGLLDPWANHAFDVRSPTTRNWVLFWAPKRLDPEVVSAPMGQDDVIPSMEGVLQLDFGMESTGMPWWDAPDDRVITAFWLGLPPTQRDEEQRHSAVGDGYHYIRTSAGVETLYDLAADPDEQTDLMGTIDVPADLSAAVEAQEAQTAGYSNRPL